MRKLTFIISLTVAAASAQATTSPFEKEQELQRATLAVLSYGGFVALVQRECLPARPAPTLVSDWQKRHKRVLDGADAFAETIFDRHRRSPLALAMG